MVGCNRGNLTSDSGMNAPNPLRTKHHSILFFLEKWANGGIPENHGSLFLLNENPNVIQITEHN